jgi:hypothetical protein
VEKHLAKWTYWAGLACAVMALIIRGFQAVGLYLDFPGVNLRYMSFYKASFLLLAVALATTVTLRPAQKE